jgi:hypothetical protein
MDAVQRMRVKAKDFSFLHSNDRVTVSSGPYVEILPIDPAYMVVPYYDPALVFVAPRRGVVIGAAIRFDFGVRLGPAFSPWGWGVTRFAWADHALILNNVRWERTWANRASYLHPYTVRPVEHHLLIPRTAQEREHERHGRPARNAPRLNRSLFRLGSSASVIISARADAVAALFFGQIES